MSFFSFNQAPTLAHLVVEGLPVQKLTLGSSRSRGNRFPWSTVTSVRRSHRCYHLNPLKESAPSTHSSQDVMQMDRPRTRQHVWPTGAAPTCIGLDNELPGCIELPDNHSAQVLVRCLVFSCDYLEPEEMLSVKAKCPKEQVFSLHCHLFWDVSEVSAWRTI